MGLLDGPIYRFFSFLKIAMDFQEKSMKTKR